MQNVAICSASHIPEVLQKNSSYQNFIIMVLVEEGPNSTEK
jgi:hypothetical protein